MQGSTTRHSPTISMRLGAACSWAGCLEASRILRRRVLRQRRDHGSAVLAAGRLHGRVSGGRICAGSPSEATTKVCCFRLGAPSLRRRACVSADGCDIGDRTSPRVGRRCHFGRIGRDITQQVRRPCHVSTLDDRIACRDGWMAHRGCLRCGRRVDVGGQAMARGGPRRAPRRTFSMRGKPTHGKLTKAQPAITSGWITRNCQRCRSPRVHDPCLQGPNRARLHSQVSDAVNVSAPQCGRARADSSGFSTIFGNRCRSATHRLDPVRCLWSGSPGARLD